MKLIPKKEDRICKCGHHLDSHISQNKYLKKIRVQSNCSKCQCTDYLYRDKPGIIDKVLVGISIGCIGLIWLAVGLISWIIDIADDGSAWNEQLEHMTLGSFVSLIYLAGLLVGVWFTLYLWNIIAGWIYERSRRTFPIDKK